MFKQASTEKYWYPVTVEFPKENGSKGTVLFDVQYKRLSDEAFKVLLERVSGTSDGDLAICREVVADWRKVTDDDGNEVPFSDDALMQLYNIGFCGPVAVTYVRSRPQAKQKN